jgi:hypothetical protein
MGVVLGQHRLRNESGSAASLLNRRWRNAGYADPGFRSLLAGQLGQDDLLANEPAGNGIAPLEAFAADFAPFHAALRVDPVRRGGLDARNPGLRG